MLFLLPLCSNSPLTIFQLPSNKEFEEIIIVFGILFPNLIIKLIKRHAIDFSLQAIKLALFPGIFFIFEYSTAMSLE
jgi:hypothetical protein